MEPGRKAGSLRLRSGQAFDSVRDGAKNRREKPSRGLRLDDGIYEASSSQIKTQRNTAGTLATLHTRQTAIHELDNGGASGETICVMPNLCRHVRPVPPVHGTAANDVFLLAETI
jgi:hypothetical protein